MMGKKPTRRQAKFIKDKNLNYDNWFVCKDTTEIMVIKHKYSGKERIIRKR